MDNPPSPLQCAGSDSFAPLLADCQRSVFLHVLSLLHNLADAEEVLQETNLVLWRKSDQYQPGTDFGKWARQIAYYEVLKFRDKKVRGERLFSNEFIEGLAVTAERSAARLDARRDMLTRCLGKLGESDRQLVSFRYRDDAKPAAIARALGRSIQGVRKSLHRIRAALLACVERGLAREERT